MERNAKSSFFNWYNFVINIGSVLSATVLVWVQNNISWGVGFAIPMVLMVFVCPIRICLCLSGRKVYRFKKLGGSPLTRLFLVVVAAVRNCHLVLPEDDTALHEVPEEKYKIAHTRQFRLFDKAAIVAAASGKKDEAAQMSPWRLCTVSQVEELNMLLRMFPFGQPWCSSSQWMHAGN